MWLTRCPQCAAAFKITAAQLDAKKGKVRCGACNSIFNATQTLEPILPTQAVPTLEVPPTFSVAVPAKPFSVKPSTFRSLTPEKSRPSVYYPAPLIVKAKKPSDLEQKSNASERLEPTWESGLDKTTTPQEAATLAAPIKGEASTDWLKPKYPPMYRAMKIGVVICFLILAIQIVYLSREAWVARFPSQLIHAQALCRFFGCTVALPKDISAMTLDNDNLKILEGKKRSVQLQAILHNQANVAQTLPHLRVKFFDRQQRLLAQYAVSPVVYLASHTQKPQWLAMQSDLPIQFTLGVHELAITDYQLSVFYP